MNGLPDNCLRRRSAMEKKLRVEDYMVRDVVSVSPDYTIE
jgi:hypothetical protein